MLQQMIHICPCSCSLLHHLQAVRMLASLIGHQAAWYALQQMALDLGNLVQSDHASSSRGQALLPLSWTWTAPANSKQGPEGDCPTSGCLALTSMIPYLMSCWSDAVCKASVQEQLTEGSFSSEVSTQAHLLVIVGPIIGAVLICTCFCLRTGTPRF